MAEPAITTVPRVGRSKPPSNCNSVVLPEPDAPTMAMRSPARTLIEAPRNTCNVTAPCMNSLTSPVPSSTTVFSSAIRSRSSVISQGFGGQQPRSTPGRIQRRHARQSECEYADLDDVRQPNVRRQIAHEIDARIQEFETDYVFQAMHQHLQVDRDQNAQHDSESYAEHSDQTSLHYEDRQNTARRRTERSQNGDIATFALHHHDHGRYDIERGDGHHRRQHDE